MANTLTYFVAHDGVHGAELWVTDGTSQGTVLHKDFNPGAGDGGVIAIVAADDQNVSVLRIGSTRPGDLVSSVLPWWPIFGPTPPPMVPGPDVVLYEIWSEGMTEPTLQKTFETETDKRFGQFFSFNNGTVGVNVFDTYWQWGMSIPIIESVETIIVKSNLDVRIDLQNFAPGGLLGSRNSQLIHDSEYIYSKSVIIFAGFFNSKIVDDNGNVLHSWIQSPSGQNSPQGSSDPVQLANGKLFFAGTEISWSLVHEYLSCIFDGEVFTVAIGINAKNLAAFGQDKILFSADDGVSGEELWISDGTPLGTFMVIDIRNETDFLDSAPSNITDLGNGHAVFLANDSEIGTVALMVTDGSASGTDTIISFNLVQDSSFEVLAPGLAVFSAALSNGNLEPWVTDGTLAGTRLLRDILPGETGSNPSDWQAIGNGRALFLADDGVHGRELWITDGTLQGTRLLKDIAPGSGGSSIGSLATISMPIQTSLTAGYGQTATGGPGSDRMSGLIGMSTLLGLGGDDSISAVGASNLIDGGSGNDSITASDGFNTIFGGDGDDSIVAGGWTNSVNGGAGNDTIEGSQGNSTIDGGAGDNRIIAHGWANIITAGDGDNFVQGGDGNSQFTLGDGDNLIQVWGWNNIIAVGDGSNTIQGMDGNATITGGDGDNLIGLNGWNNQVTLGNGDNAIFAGWGGNTRISGGDGHNTIQLQGWGNEVVLGDGGNVVWAGMGMSRIVTGSGADQVFIGASGLSDVSTGAGDDVIYTGGAFYDVLRGGAGNDQYVVRHGTVSIIELAGEGIDTAWVEIDGYVAPAHVEIVRLVGTATNLTGSGGGDTLVANQALASTIDGAAGDDVIYGSAFGDVITGGLGNDTIYAGEGLDRYVFGAPGWGQDVIALWEAGETLDFRGSGLSSGDLNLQVGPGYVLVGRNGFTDTIQVYGTTALGVGDFLF